MAATPPVEPFQNRASAAERSTGKRIIGHATRLPNHKISAFYDQRATRNADNATLLQKQSDFRGAAAALVRAMEDRFRAQVYRCLTHYLPRTLGIHPTDEDFARIGQQLNARHDLDSLREMLIQVSRLSSDDKSTLRRDLQEYIFDGINYGVLTHNLQDAWYSTGAGGTFVLRVDERDVRVLRRRWEFLTDYFGHASFALFYPKSAPAADVNWDMEDEEDETIYSSSSNG